MSSLMDRALGAYLGCAVGDALGATVEFMTRREIAHQYGVHRHIKGGGWLHLKPGEVTDDTEMNLALGRAILKAGGWDMRLVAEEFTAWLRSKPKDCGNTCRRGIRRYITDGTLTKPPADGDGGNGALMRILPVVLATLGDDDAFETRVLEQAHFTHNNPLSDAAILTIGHMIRHLVLGGTMRSVHPLAADLVARQPKFRYQPYPGRASAFVGDTVQTVLHFYFLTDGFETCLIETVNQGDDADTTGAIAGMLAGATYGIDAIPRRWQRRLDPLIVHEIHAQTDGLMALSPHMAGLARRDMDSFDPGV